MISTHFFKETLLPTLRSDESPPALLENPQFGPPPRCHPEGFYVFLSWAAPIGLPLLTVVRILDGYYSFFMLSAQPGLVHSGGGANPIFLPLCQLKSST